MFTILIMIHVLICVGLIIVVLMQSAKGEGLAGAFGGGGGGLSGAVFGGRGAASFLSKATTILAVLFMVSCLGLSLMSSGRSTAKVVEGESAITKAAQKDIQQQQEKMQQEQSTKESADQGKAASPEDIFNMPATQQQSADSQ